MSELGVTDFDPSADAAETVAALERTHGQAMFGFIRRQGLTDPEGQDAVQETMLRLLRELRAGARIENPRAWAYRALYRVAMDQHRLRRRFTLVVGRLDPRDETAPPSNDRVAVWAEVDRLPNRQREVLYLRYRGDLSFEDIGQTLGITASAARSHATQAMTTLRGRLSREDFE